MSSKFTPSSENSSTEVDLRVEVPESEDDIRAILQIVIDQKLLQTLRKGQQKKPKGTREKTIEKNVGAKVDLVQKTRKSMHLLVQKASVSGRKSRIWQLFPS